MLYLVSNIGCKSHKHVGTCVTNFRGRNVQKYTLLCFLHVILSCTTFMNAQVWRMQFAAPPLRKPCHSPSTPKMCAPQCRISSRSSACSVFPQRFLVPRWPGWAALSLPHSRCIHTVYLIFGALALFLRGEVCACTTALLRFYARGKISTPMYMCERATSMHWQFTSFLLFLVNYQCCFRRTRVRT